MRKLSLILISLLTMLLLPAWVNSPAGEPYLSIKRTKELGYTTTYTQPYDDLLKHLSNSLATNKPKEVTEVFVWQDQQGNLHFSDQQQSKSGETVYQAETQSTGRLAFPRYWVPGFMLAIWLITYLLLYATLTILRHYFRRQGNEKHSAHANEKVKQEEAAPERSLTLDHTPYKVLGINTQATLDEIKAAYSQKIRQYHPDRVAHLGEELQVLARKKSAAINQAYQSLTMKEKDETATKS